MESTFYLIFIYDKFLELGLLKLIELSNSAWSSGGVTRLAEDNRFRVFFYPWSVYSVECFPEDIGNSLVFVFSVLKFRFIFSSNLLLFELLF